MAFKLTQAQIDEIIRLRDNPVPADGLHPLGNAYAML